MKRSLLVAGIVLCRLAGLAETYVWTASDRPTSLGDGAITAVWDGEAVTNLTKHAVGDATLAGDAIAFGPDAQVALEHEGTLGFDMPVTAAGGLSVSNASVRAWQDGNLLSVSAASPTTVLTGLRLEDWTPCSASTDPSFKIAIQGTGMAYHVTRLSGDELTAQFQIWDGWVKCVKVRFR